MKKILLSICVALLYCIAFAQTNVVVVLKNGTELKYAVEDIDSIRIENITAVPVEETGLCFVYDDALMTASVTFHENFDPIFLGMTPNYDLSEIKIPSKVFFNGNVYVVTSIGSYAFAYCAGLTSIEIPNSVTSIADHAFAYCENLSSLEIPNLVTTIGFGAFKYCTSLSSIEIPNSITKIDPDAFTGCASLTSIVVDKDNKVYDSRENCNGIIETKNNTIVAGCKSTVILNSVTTIGMWAFCGCENITSIEIPKSVTEIEQWAFFDCKNITSVEISNSVTEIGANAFDGCKSLKTARVPKGCTLGANAFPADCLIEWYGDEETTTAVPAEETDFFGIFDEANMTASVSKLLKTDVTELIIPQKVIINGNVYSVTEIGTNAFKDCAKLTSIEIRTL